MRLKAAMAALMLGLNYFSIQSSSRPGKGHESRSLLEDCVSTNAEILPVNGVQGGAKVNKLLQVLTLVLMSI